MRLKKLKLITLLLLGFGLMGLQGQTTGTFNDSRDGKVYKTVKIGEQVWMAENLAYKPDSGNYWAYDDKADNIAVYGYLYDWETAKKGCPTGWHLPSDAEWRQLEYYLADNGYNYDGTLGGGREKIAKSLASTSGWNSSSNKGETGNTDYPTYRNKSGFTALPSGSRFSYGEFYDNGDSGSWWSATEDRATSAWTRYVGFDYSGVGRLSKDKRHGCSVRCVKD